MTLIDFTLFGEVNHCSAKPKILSPRRGYLSPENILIQVLKSSSETLTDPNVYQIEISDDRIYPAAYDACQTILEKECLQDPFICALFSKAKGQYLRLALPLHALFQPSPLPDIMPNIIPEPVQKASISLVGLCIEHTALLAGREVKDGKLTPREPCISQETELECTDKVLQQIIINYPGKYVSASKVNHLSKFRRLGGKSKVLMIFTTLEHKNLGEIYHAKNKATFFIKQDSQSINDDDLPQFLRSLQHLGLTLEAYNAAYENDTHPNAAETLGQYNQATEGVKEQTAKRIKIDDAMSSIASKEK